MDIGKEVLSELKHKQCVGRCFLYSEVQQLKAIRDRAELYTFLGQCGYANIDTSQSAFHIANDLEKGRKESVRCWILTCAELEPTGILFLLVLPFVVAASIYRYLFRIAR